MKTQAERGKDWLHITFLHSSTSEEGTSGGGGGGTTLAKGSSS